MSYFSLLVVLVSFFLLCVLYYLLILIFVTLSLILLFHSDLYQNSLAHSMREKAEHFYATFLWLVQKSSRCNLLSLHTFFHLIKEMGKKDGQWKSTAATLVKVYLIQYKSTVISMISVNIYYS